MRRYSEAVKADVRRRMHPPHRQSVTRISEELGIHVMTLFAAPVPMRASGVINPLSIAGGLPGAYAPGEPNAVCRRCTRSGAALPAALLLAASQIARY